MPASTDSSSATGALTVAERKILEQGFLGFVGIFSLSMRVARRNFTRVLGPILLYKGLLLLAASLGLGLLGLVLFSQIGSAVPVEINGETYTFDQTREVLAALTQSPLEPNSPVVSTPLSAAQIEQLLMQNTAPLLTILLTLFLGGLLLAWQYAKLYLRTFQMLARPEQRQVFATGSALNRPALRLLMLEVFVGLVAGTLQESLAPFVGIDASTGYTYLWQFVWYSLAGLAVYRLVTGEGILIAVRASYRRSIEFYWRNVSRWLLFYAILLTVLLAGAVGLGVILGVLATVWTPQPVVLAILLFGLGVLGLLVGLACEALVQVFGWVSYSNLDALYIREKAD